MRMNIVGTTAVSVSAGPATNLEVNAEVPIVEAGDAVGLTYEITDDYVSQIAVEDGEVIVVYGNKAREQIAGKTLTLVPDASNSPEVSWTCNSLDIPDKWLTSMCRTRR